MIKLTSKRYIYLLFTISVIFILSILFIFTYNHQTIFAGACHTYTNPTDVQDIPSGFGSPFYEVGDKSLFIRADCQGQTTTINIGNNDPQTYIYKDVYVWNGSNWNKRSLTSNDNWVKGSASILVNANELSDPNSAVAVYICTLESGQWKCGCRDSACEGDSARKWQLQRFSQDVQIQTGTVNTGNLALLEMGGTNYAMMSIGNYDGSTATWGQVRPVIRLYHENPSLVRNQLQQMYNNGQRKIALFLWYTRTPQGVIHGHHAVTSNGGRLNSKHEQNLVNLLNDIKNTGFDTLYFRFGTQDQSHPHSWTSWNEELYQENKNFVFSTRDLVTSTMAGSGIPVWFDLENEIGGAWNGQAGSGQQYDYQYRLWRDYVGRYGSGADTVGFSQILRTGTWASEQMRNLKEIYGNHMPPKLAGTIYGDELEKFTQLRNNLANNGWSNMPFVVIEGYYNDQTLVNEILNARNNLGVRIHTLIQWPLTREGANAGKLHFDIETPLLLPDFVFGGGGNNNNNNESVDGGGNNTGGEDGGAVIELPEPVIESAGAGCAELNCVWIRGNNFGTRPTVDVRTINYWGNPPSAQFPYRNYELYRSGNLDVLTLELPSHLVPIFHEEGLHFWVINDSSKWNVKEIFIKP